MSQDRQVDISLQIAVPLGAWVAQSVGHLTSIQVMISQFTSSSPASGSVLTARSLLRIPCLPLSLPLPAHALSLSQKINKKGQGIR